MKGDPAGLTLADEDQIPAIFKTRRVFFGDLHDRRQQIDTNFGTLRQTKPRPDGSSKLA
jgi:hypothetical protein